MLYFFAILGRDEGVILLQIKAMCLLVRWLEFVDKKSEFGVSMRYICSDKGMLGFLDIMEPNKHMHMYSASLLELEPVEICFDIAPFGDVIIVEHMLRPPLVASAAQITACYLFKYVCYGYSLVERQVCRHFAGGLSDFVYPPRERKGPFIRTNGQENVW